MSAIRTWACCAMGLLLVAATSSGCSGVGREAPPSVVSAASTVADLVPTGFEAPVTPQVEYWGLSADGDGVLWSTDPGVTMFDPATGVQRTFTVADDAAFGEVQSLAPSLGGGAWLTTSDRLRRFDGERFTEVVDTPTSMDYVAEAPDGTVWTFDENDPVVGVWSWDGSTWRRLPDGRRGPLVAAMAIDAIGRVWTSDYAMPEITMSGPTGTQARGVSMWDGQSWTGYSSDEVRLMSPYALTMSGTPDGAMWLGGFEGDLARFADGDWMAFGSAQTGMNWIQSIVQDPDGTMWIGGGTTVPDPAMDDPTDSVVVARDDDGEWTQFRESSGLPVEGVPAIAEVAVADGQVWAASNHVLRSFTGGEWHGVTEEPAAKADSTAPGNRIGQLAAPSAEVAWGVDQLERRLWRVDDEAWSSPTMPGRLASGVSTVALGADGGVWAGTDTGLVRHDGKRWSDVGPGLPITALTVAPDGTVWAGSVSTLLHLSGAEVLSNVEMIDEFFGDLAVTPDGAVWAVPFDASASDSPRVLRDGVWTDVPIDAGADAVPTALTVDADGRVWAVLSIRRPSSEAHPIGTWSPGAARYDGAAWTVYRLSEQPTDGTYDSGLAFAPDGTGYFASEAGLFTFNGSAWVRWLGGRWSDVTVAPGGAVWLAGETVVVLPPVAQR